MGVFDHMCYHMVMARREVLVQLDDDLVQRLDEIASNLGISRSELLRRGAQAVISAEELAESDRDLVAAYRRQPPDAALIQSARRLAARTAAAW
jgi:Ribbon-helix-helix protein, copG family